MSSRSTLFSYLPHFVVVALGIIISYSLVSKHNQLLQYFRGALEPVPINEGDIFTASQLLQYNGRDSKSLYLVILGHVYDVTKGEKHYGEGQAYHMFVGHDATRSFVTGEFDHYTEELSDVSSLTDTELKQLLTWREFYDKTYPYRGKAIGRYFDQFGKETAYHRHVLDRAAKAEETKNAGTTYPSCNVEWKKDIGTRVWCTNRSGDGVERQWTGLPRKVVSSGNGDDDDQSRSIQFCACVPEEVTDTQYVAFPGCEANAVSCIIPDQN